MSTEASRVIRIAVPSDAPGGLDAARSGHFGRSPNFTVVDVIDGAVGGIAVVANDSQDDVGCLTPVLRLGENLVDVVIVAGIERKPLLNCVQAGVRVFAGEDRPDVRSVVEAFLEAELSPVGPDSTYAH